MYKFVKYEMDGELKIPGSCKKNYFFISNLCKTWHFLTFVLKRLAYLRKLFTVRKPLPLESYSYLQFRMHKIDDRFYFFI